MLSAACGEDSAEDSSNRNLDNQESDEHRPANQEGEEAAEDHFNGGVKYFHSGEYRLAIEDYDKAIELDPNYTDAYHKRGMPTIS